MIVPQIAPVRPRVVSPQSGVTLLLEEVVADCLYRTKCRSIRIAGGPAAGKTTAIKHLAAKFSRRSDLRFADVATAEELGEASPQCLVYTGPPASHADLALKLDMAGGTLSFRLPPASHADLVLKLAPWTDDDLLEYLLAVHPCACASVMRRIQADGDRAALEGNPALWVLVLDEMAADGKVETIREVVERLLLRTLPGLFGRLAAGKLFLAMLMGDKKSAFRTLARLSRDYQDFEHLWPLRHPYVQRLLAAERLAGQLARGRPGADFAKRLPPELIAELARLAKEDRNLIVRLEELLDRGAERFHSTAASILFAASKVWRPPSGRSLHLSGGRFPRASWPGIVLTVAGRSSKLFDADLSGADLSGARLDEVVAFEARMPKANLRGASLVRTRASCIDLSRADLRRATADWADFYEANLRRARCSRASFTHALLRKADVRGASFRRANLAYADLSDCQVAGADFTDAQLVGAVLRRLKLREAVLTGARFSEAIMSECDLEGIELVDAQFDLAQLDNAWLTGSVLPRADFRNAYLRGAGLADIQWEKADLRGADLRDCSFHMGSTRSGLVGSPYPGHGSKTGFYTDDYHDQGFKAAEEIRKANLCGADLRGAKLEGVDFYLVDLRGALFDPEIEDHLQRCGAILYDRCR